MVDLHVHSTASDGTKSPAELVQMACALGLCALAITDHDTVDGIGEGEEEARRLGLDFLCGVELSVEYERDAVTHILGYFAGRHVLQITSWLEWILEKRDERNRNLLLNLRGAGYLVSEEELADKAGDGTPGRPHVAALLMEKGYADSQEDAFNRILNRRDIHVKREKTTPETAIRAILEWGGVPVLAHPVYLEKDNLLPKALDAFTSLGLKGLEAYHSDHTKADTRRYLGLAKRHGLLVTGGSDYHGDIKSGIHLGGQSVPDACYHAVRACLEP
ncbi:MAG: PHP domain-containing protein [Clostridia bacterium]